MRTKLVILLLSATACAANAQTSIEEILQQIKDNNPTLSALRKQTEAEKIGNHTGLSLDDPEIEFAHLWGSPTVGNNRKNLDISQSFDMATIFGIKRRLAKQQDQLADYQYMASQNELLLQARLLCIDVIYYNALLKNLSLQKENAQEIASDQKSRLDNGEGNKMECNNALVSLAVAKAEIQKQEVERNDALSQLKALNGGKDITLNDAEFPVVDIPADFDSWYRQAEQKNPTLAYARQAVDVAKQQVSTAKADGLPKFTAGYSGEFQGDDKLNGFTVGMSIPLWGNKNRVKQAKAETEAAQARQADAKLQLYNSLRNLYNKQAGLKQVDDTYHEVLTNTTNIHLLKKALDAGSISVSDYRMEVNAYYDMNAQHLDAMRSWQKVMAEMLAAAM